MIIDFHTHTFPDKIAGKVIKKLAGLCRSMPYTDGTTGGLLRSMKEASVDYSVTLPVMTDAGQVVKIHDSILENLEELHRQGIVPFGGMHPDFADYRRELFRIREGGIRGIKLHPAYQNIDLDDIRMLRIIDAASEAGLIVSIHAGIDIGITDHNYASAAHILKVVEEVHPENFVLAHMGNWACWEDTERYLCGAPVWLDTSFSIGEIVSNPESTERPLYDVFLSDEDFVRIVRKHGTEKVLFATDSPWKEQRDYVTRIQNLPLTEGEKEQILGENARKLLRL